VHSNGGSQLLSIVIQALQMSFKRKVLLIKVMTSWQRWP